MKTIICAVLFVSAFSASAQVADVGDFCPYSIDKKVVEKGRAEAEKIADLVEADHGVACTYARHFRYLEITPDIFKYKCSTPDGKKLVLKVKMGGEYCQPDTVHVRKYKVKFK